MREEREVVTALFVDIVGSTAIAERLDPEDVKLVIGDAVARVIGAVEAYGGTVKDLAGDGVLALFGAPRAHEDDPERAVRAGLQAVADIEAYGREVERAFGIEGFSVRVGVNTGPVVVGAIGAGSRVEYGALGDALNTAARLQSNAEPSEVLVGEDTHRLIEPLFDWTDPRPLALKGKAEPVTAYGATGARAAPGRLRGLETVQTPLVGRETELAAGNEVVEAALAGSGGILALTGEPASARRGCSRSSASVSRAGRWRTARVPGSRDGACPTASRCRIGRTATSCARGSGCSPTSPSFGSASRCARNVERLFADRAAEIYPYLGAILGLTLEPEAAARLAELSPEALQYRSFEVVRSVLRRLAEDGPLAVALEDLHWVDATSLQLLERMLADTEDVALLLVLTTRLERDHPSWRVKETAARELPHRTRELALEALSGDAGRELLHALVGEGTMPTEMERRILEPAEGNPFFLEELVRSLVDTGALVRSDGGWAVRS